MPRKAIRDPVSGGQESCFIISIREQSKGCHGGGRHQEEPEGCRERSSGSTGQATKVITSRSLSCHLAAWLPCWLTTRWRGRGTQHHAAQLDGVGRHRAIYLTVRSYFEGVQKLW